MDRSAHSHVKTASYKKYFYSISQISAAPKHIQNFKAILGPDASRCVVQDSVIGIGRLIQFGDGLVRFGVADMTADSKLWMREETEARKCCSHLSQI